MTVPIAQEGETPPCAVPRSALTFAQSCPSSKHSQSTLLVLPLVRRSYHACSIRNRLTALKRDRGEYIKASDVTSIYQAVVKQGTHHPSAFYYVPPIAHLTKIYQSRS